MIATERRTSDGLRDIVIGPTGTSHYGNDRVALVSQRLESRLLAWAGENKRNRDAGLPYATGIFGFGSPEAVVALILAVATETDGVDAIIEDEFDLTGRALSISLVVQIGDETPTIEVIVQ